MNSQSPQPELRCTSFVWRRLMDSLRERGRGRTRESGAFLLGERLDGCAHIVDFLLYDDLDPQCLDTGIVWFDGRYFGQLWETCKQRGLSVVADVHVHPEGAGQSTSDRAHPMISRAGHIALIVPRFADPPVTPHEVGIYRYLGSKRWWAVPPDARHTFFQLDI